MNMIFNKEFTPTPKQELASLKRTSKKSSPCLVSGFTFVEIIVAITVTLVGVLGIYALVPRIVGEVAFNYDRFIAIQLAREGIELVRAIRDGNYLEVYKETTNSWKEGLTGCSAGCEMDYTILGNGITKDPVIDNWTSRYLKIDASGFYNGFYNYIAGSNTKFKRKITLTQLSPAPTPAGFGDVIEVKVEIYWPDYSVAPSPKNYVVIKEQIYDWRN